jgi:uncharacterized protein (TIGR03546 family)
VLAILKFLQSLIKTLHSEGTPTQIGFGVALGAALGLTPIANLHNLLVLLILAVLNVSFGAGMLAWGVFVPVGFILDPLFDRIGHWLLVDVAALRPMWTAWDNTPVLALTNFSNTIVLGSVVAWLVLFLPIYFAVRFAVLRYRATLGERFRQSQFYRLVSASQLYNVYRWFSP